MSGLLNASNWLSGLQWLFFIFINTIVIPISVGAAFELPQETIGGIIQLSFILTGIACMVQGLFGHGRAIMEGQSGLWWGVILTLTSTAAAQGVSLTELGGSLTVGVFISSILTVIIGIAGLGPYLAKLFNPGVMGVFMFLFGATLITIFLKGMIGIPFGNAGDSAAIDLPVSLLSILIVILVTVISIKAPPGIRRYGLLIGIIIGWIAYRLLFGSEEALNQTGSLEFEVFPLGKPAWNLGIILTTVFTGLLNVANTFGALRGTEDLYQVKTTAKQYRYSFTLTGIFTATAGVFGLVPYAPYVSSIGFLNQTGIINRMPIILGGFMFFVMGIIPPIGNFFALLPLSIGSAVLFVSYLQMLNSSWSFFNHVHFNTLNIYRSAIPLFVGLIIMTFPSSYFSSMPEFIRPLISNGLLVGIILALIMENLFDWDQNIKGPEAE